MMFTRKRVLAAVVAAATAAPLLLSHQSASAAALAECPGLHQWVIPNNSTNFSFTGTVLDGWNRVCAAVNTDAAPFGLVTVNPDSSGQLFATTNWAGNCALSFSSSLSGGIRFFIGAVTVGAGIEGSPQASAGVLGVPSSVPCSGGGAITWNGVESFTPTAIP